jgi:hypothetical protein
VELATGEIAGYEAAERLLKSGWLSTHVKARVHATHLADLQFVGVFES